MVTLAFWGLCVLAGAAHPLVLLSYARLFANRKRSIDALYAQTARTPIANDRGSLGSVLTQVYEQESNWRGFFVPVAMCSLLSMAAVATIIQKSGVTNPLGLDGTALATYLQLANGTAVLGFAGAYLASVYSLIDRFRSLTLSTFLLHLAWFRLVFGAVFGGIIPGFVAAGVAAPAAFAIGFLPIREILDQLVTVARKAFGSDSGNQPHDELSWNLVQGATPDIVERLEEADVTSVAALASQNPIALMHRTNIPWRVLLDLMDQSILISYVGDKITALRTVGVRGAIEAGIVYRRGDDADAQGTIVRMGSILQCETSCVKNLIRNLAEDSQVSLLHQLWFDTDADGHGGAAAGPEPRVVYYVPEDGVAADVVAAVREQLKRFGAVADDHVTLSEDADVEQLTALLRHAGFRFGPSSLSGPSH